MKYRYWRTNVSSTTNPITLSKMTIRATTLALCHCIAMISKHKLLAVANLTHRLTSMCLSQRLCSIALSRADNEFCNSTSHILYLFINNNYVLYKKLVLWNMVRVQTEVDSRYMFIYSVNETFFIAHTITVITRNSNLNIKVVS